MRVAVTIAYLALAAVAVAAFHNGREPRARPIASELGGSFEYENSRQGAPIFTATEIAPGARVTGTVSITNAGDDAGQVTLSQHDLLDQPGSEGGLLSQRLSMQIDDVTAPAAPRPVYNGALASMPPRQLGNFAAGESRTYEFAATLLENAGDSAAENAVQGASASVAYAWTASAAIPDAPKAAPTPSEEGRGASPTPPESAPLRLKIARVGRAIARGRLVIRTRCSSPCAIRARGRLSGRPGKGHTRVRFRPTRRRHSFKSSQRVVLRARRARIPVLRAAALSRRPSVITLVIAARNQADARTVRRVHLRLRGIPALSRGRALFTTR